MNDPTPHIDRLGLARDRLAEARRYVRTQPNAARKILAGVIRVLHDLADGMTKGMIPMIVDRCWANINTIRSAIGVDPDAACGGIDLVRHELAILMFGLRRKWAQEGRDRGTAK